MRCLFPAIICLAGFPEEYQIPMCDWRYIITKEFCIMPFAALESIIFNEHLSA